MRVQSLSVCISLFACAPVTQSQRPVPAAPTQVEPEPVTTTGPGEIEDYAGTSGELTETAPAPMREPHPLVNYSDEELEEMLLNNPEALGTASIGRPSAGSLFGGVPMPEGPEWTIVNPRETWGTPETIAYLTHTVRRINELYPETPVLHIGDIGRESGGFLAPHVSHQSGRDVDIGYYYTTDEKWYTTANQSNLDLQRTWAFVRITIAETDVQALFIDRRIQKELRAYAEQIGEDPAWLDKIFGGETSNLRPLIMHEDGHETHIHVRYYNPVAQETGRRIYSALLKHKMVKPPTYYVDYKVKRGDTLLKIAKKFNTSVDALKKANRLRSTRIIANRVYKIPRRGGVAAVDSPIAIPARRIPPPPGSTAPDPGIRTATDDNGSGL